MIPIQRRTLGTELRVMGSQSDSLDDKRSAEMCTGLVGWGTRHGRDPRADSDDVMPQHNGGVLALETAHGTALPPPGTGHWDH
jgi:hypothetical protein